MKIDDMLMPNQPREPADPAEIEAYFDGLKDAFVMWAYWKDGIQYLGSCGQYLNEGLEAVEKARLNAHER